MNSNSKLSAEVLSAMHNLLENEKRTSLAPTTWNIGPQDDKGNPGAVEAALTGLKIEDVCTVHAHDVKLGKELAKFKI